MKFLILKQQTVNPIGDFTNSSSLVYIIIKLGIKYIIHVRIITILVGGGFLLQTFQKLLADVSPTRELVPVIHRYTIPVIGDQMAAPCPPSTGGHSTEPPEP